MWAIYGAVGVGGAGIGGCRAVWAGGVMEPRNTLNTRKIWNSSSLELEFENGIGDCWVRGVDRINGINRIE